MDHGGLRRRGLLWRSMAVAGGAALTSLAGCSALPGVGGEDGRYDWMWEPGTVGAAGIGRVDHYTFHVVDYGAIRAHQSAFDEDTYESYRDEEELFEATGTSFDSMGLVLSFRRDENAARVLDGSYDRGAVRRELAEDDFDDEEYGDYTIWEREDRGVAYAVGSSLLKTQPVGGQSAEEVAETLIDTKQGEENRYRAERDAMRTLLEVLGTPTEAWGGTSEPQDEHEPARGVFENSVAWGQAKTVESETSTKRFVEVFESESDADPDPFQYWVDAEREDRLRNMRDIEISQQGRTVVVEGTIDTEDF